ncbi:pentapeptide repeat-containing protein [Polyangium aurulentum]|uniref:pentapeptide repeat-containing protein n=1 Tax=Polyangium aurulentum TaxID=2567896 RepID=UPI00146EF25D|nr:pentapeptide repeat-containing protein [Polyangium aurulentum]UQA56170.1 pentapeptide repeat-containing protein [Polyangium aurulentum]
MGIPPSGNRKPRLVAYAQRRSVDLALDAGHVYWSSIVHGTIARAPLGGGPAETLVAGLDRVSAIAVGEEHVYWLVGHPFPVLMRAPLGGGEPTALGIVPPVHPAVGFDPHPIERLLSAAPDARQLILRAHMSAACVMAGGHVFYSANYATKRGSEQGLWKARLEGDERERVSVEQEGVRSIVADETHVYWTGIYKARFDERRWTERAVLKKAPLAGGEPIALATNLSPGLRLAVHGGTLYWTDAQSGTVTAMSTEGGPMVVLADGQRKPTTLAVNADAIAWSNNESGNVFVLALRDEIEAAPDLADIARPFTPAAAEDGAFATEVESACRSRQYPGVELERVDVPFAAPFHALFRMKQLVWRGPQPRNPLREPDRVVYAVPVPRPTRDALDAFLLAVALDRETMTFDGAVMVYKDEPPSTALFEAAAEHGIRFERLDQFQGQFTPELYAAWQTARLAKEQAYAPELFAPLKARVDGPADAGEDALDALRRLFDGEGGMRALVLGDAGSGKSFLLRQLARAMAGDRGLPVPILIDAQEARDAMPLEMVLRGKGQAAEAPRRKELTLDALLVSHCNALGIGKVDLAALLALLATGRVALLIENLELVRVDGGADAVDSLVASLRGLPATAKVVVALRSTFFPTREVSHLFVEASTPEGARAHLIELLPFGREDVAPALEKRNPKVRPPDGDLLELARNPRFLALLAESDSGQREKARLDQFYRELIQLWPHRQEGRASSVAPRWIESEDPVTYIAQQLWFEDRRSLARPELDAWVAAFFGERAAFTIWAPGFGTGALLTRDDEGQWSFLHPSIAEWLVAGTIANALDPLAFGLDRTELLLLAQPMSPRMAGFLAERADPFATDWARHTLEQRGGSDAAIDNAQAILEYLGDPPPARPMLLRARLAGQDLAGRSLRNADLREADLSTANLRGADLSGADLRRAILRGADLTGADLSFARLMRADLRGATLRGARLVAAKLIAAELDDGALDGCDARGAALDLSTAPAPALLLPSHPQCLAFSPDSAFLATGHLDGSIRIWDVQSGTCLRFLQGDESVGCVAFHPGGEKLAACCGGRVWSWNWASGTPEIILQERPSSSVVAFSPDGRKLVGAIDGHMRVWDLATASERLAFHNETGGGFPMCVAWSPDSARIITAFGRAVRVWDAETGANLRALRGLARTAYALAISPDGNTIAASGENGIIHFWDAATGEARPPIHVGAPLRSMAFSPDWTRVAVGAGNGVVIAGVSSDAAPRARLPIEHSTAAIAWSPDGKRLAAIFNDLTIRFWDTATLSERSARTGPLRHLGGLAFRADGRALVVNPGGPAARAFDTGTFAERSDQVLASRSFPDPWDPPRLAGQPRETRIRSQLGLVPEEGAVTSANGAVRVSLEGHAGLRVVETATGRERPMIRGSFTHEHFALHPNGSQLAANCRDGAVRVWDTRDGALLATLVSLPGGWLVVTPEGRYKLGGVVGDIFWHAVGLCRFAPGELEPYLDAPLLVPRGAPLPKSPPPAPLDAGLPRGTRREDGRG